MNGLLSVAFFLASEPSSGARSFESNWLIRNGATVLLILAGVLILIGALLGFFRGFKRAFIRFFTVAAAFFGSLFACRFLLSDTRKVMENAWMQKLIAKVDVLADLQKEVPEAYEHLVGLPVAILSPVIFVALFLVAAFFLELVSMILGFFAGPKRSFRLLGLLIGAVQGVIFTVALMIPLSGLLTNAVSAMETIEQENTDSDSDPVASFAAELKPQLLAISDSPLYQLVDKYAGTPVCQSLMRYTVDGEEINIKDETDNVARFSFHAGPLLRKQIKDYSRKQIKAMYKMVDAYTLNDNGTAVHLKGDIDRSKVFPPLIVEILNAAGKAWGEGKPFLSIDAPKAEGDFNKALKELFRVMETTSTEPVSADPDAKSVIASDLKTLVDLLDVFEKHGVFPIIDQPDAIKQKMKTDPTLIPDARAALRANPRYDAVCDALERPVVTSVISVPATDSPKYAEFRNMTEDVANALNSLSAEDRQTFFENPTSLLDNTTPYGSQLRTALQNYDVNSDMINISKELISDALNEEFGERIKNGETVTASDVESFLRTYSGN